MPDRCLELVRDHSPVDVEPLVRFALKYTGVLHRTPIDRIAAVAQEEVTDLVARAAAAVAGLGPELAELPFAREAAELLVPPHIFPRAELAALAARVRATGGPDHLADVLESFVAKHVSFEGRLDWLLNGTPPDVLTRLDPLVDTDRIHHAVASTFRFESRVLEMMAINRIAQSSTIGTFFRSTREAENNPIYRFYDTYALYSSVWEWGLDSRRGRGAVERMNQIHGRYYIPNAEMKYVLVQGAFTWLDGADRIAHRRLTEAERTAMFVGWSRMGRAMNIQDLTDDYAREYAWYQAVGEANRDHTLQKRDTYETIVRASAAGQPEELVASLLLASRVAMDDTYIASVGYDRPTREETQAVRAVFFTVGSLIEKLPYTPFVRSLQNNPARQKLVDPTELGTPSRSTWMPSAHVERPNGGFPEWQTPIGSPGEVRDIELRVIEWDEVRAHTTAESLWTVIDGVVYDLTPMLRVHPGGAEVLLRWAGRDATAAFRAAPHTAGTLTFTLNYRIGRVPDGHDDAPI